MFGWLKKKKTQKNSHIFPADHRMKMKGSEKRNKYLDLAREQKLSGMRVTGIPVVVGALGSVTKVLKRSL